MTVDQFTFAGRTLNQDACHHNLFGTKANHTPFRLSTHLKHDPPIQRMPVSVIISKAKELIDEITALNVSSLNLRGVTPARIDTDGHMDQKVNQLYQVLHQLKTEYGYNGKII